MGRCGFVVFLTALMLTGVCRAEFAISEGGRAAKTIVCSSDAPPAVRHAAQELKHFLDQITGGEFEVDSSVPPEHRAAILVGPGAVKEAGYAFEQDELGKDGIVIRVEDGHLILAGDPPRGTLYAVYDFLERYVGCRWWTSKASHIPRRADLSPVIGNIRYTPPFEYRYSFWTDAFDPDWAVRNKSNGPNGLADPHYGGYVTHGGVHTFYELIPPQKYFEDHPEWFSLIDGERTADGAQLCLTNREMRRQLIENLKEEMTRNAHEHVFSVSQNDWYRNCQCEDCRTLDEREGSPSGSLLAFVNGVAEEIEGDFPQNDISTLAYQYTRTPPRSLKPRDNVVIQLCSIECSFAVPLSHDRNSAFREDIVGWSRIADRLYVWDYTTNFRHYFMPHPNLHVLGPNIRFFAEHNVVGLFEQGAYTSPGAEFAELRAWVLAQLMWDPSRDDRALIEEFCRGYYGAAGRHILDYIALVHKAAAQQAEYAHCLPPYSYDFPYLDFELLSEALELFSVARTAVEDSAELLERVEMAELPVLYAFMWKWGDLRAQAESLARDWPLERDIESVAARFKRVARENGVTRVNEWDEGFGLIDRAVARANKSNTDN